MLSKKYGLTVDQLRTMNGLVNHLLEEGQVLVVPAPPLAFQPLP